MKKLLFIGILFSVSCSSESEPQGPPSDILSKEKMIPLMVDLKVLEQHYHRLYVRPDVYSSALDSASTFVFSDHGTTKDVFTKSVDYYTKDVNGIFDIYEAALDTINLRVSGGNNPSSTMP